jgi:hypothetical protein
MTTLNQQLVGSLALLDSAKGSLYGFFDDMDYETYRKIPAVNYSSLKHMMRSPLAYRYFMDNPRPSTPAMDLGKHTHRMILEPNQVGDFAVWGELEGQKVRRGKIWDEFQAECAISNKQVITKDERAGMIGMAQAVRKSALAMRYLDGGRSEISCVWRDKKFNRDCKGRFDKVILIGGKPHIVDLKTTRDSRPMRFGNEAYRLGYHIQLAMYEEGYRIITGETPKMIEVAVENKPPYELVVYEVSDDVLFQGHEDYTRLMKLLGESERTGVWPPSEESITTLSLPSYAYGSDADEFSFADLIEGESEHAEAN